MQRILVLFFLMLAHWGFAQKYISSSGSIKFYSEEILEDITAINHKVKSIFDSKTGQIVFSVPVTGFEFKKSLMQEHFNEKYLETERYPVSTFKGTILGYEVDKRNPDVWAEGVLELHGVKQRIKVSGSLNYGDGILTMHSVFKLALIDYDIKIPSLMFQKIAEEIEVTLNIEYSPYEK